jgi:endonuclease III
MKKKLIKVAKVLEKEYNSPNFNNKSDPVKELIYIILSKRTNFKANNHTYNKLIAEYTDISTLASVSIESIINCIKSGGLAREKAENISSMLQIINEDFGTFNIKKFLATWKENNILSYFLSLPGIGEKSAKCVMLYSLRLSVQPADSHVIRLFNRLGFTNIDQYNHHQAQKRISQICKGISYEYNYMIHVNFKAHGQNICKNNNPECRNCLIKNWCEYFLNPGEDLDE